MGKLKRPLRLWHGLLAVVAALAVGAAGTAIAGGGQSKNLTTAGIPPRGVFRDSGKYHYGLKLRSSNPGVNQQGIRLKCPRGTRVVGGGGGGDSVDPTEQFLNYSGPFDNRDRGRARDDGWIVFVNNFDTEGEVIAAEAICRDNGK